MAALAVAEITRAETQRRARLLAVHSYAVDLDLTRGEQVFGSRTVIRFDCTEPGAEVHADLIAAAVHEITLNGAPLDPALACAGRRIALPGLAAVNELIVLADCAYTTSGTGMHRRTDSADGLASRSDLLQAVSRRSGLDLTAWSRAWLETAGPRTLRCEFTAGQDGRFAAFAVTQEPPPGDDTARPMLAGVGLYRRSGQRLVLARRIRADRPGRRPEVPELVGEPWPDLVLPNDGDLAYAAVRLDPRSLRTMTESLGDLDDPLARAVGWNAVIDMVQQAELPVQVFVLMLAREFGREPSVAVLGVLTAVAERMLARLADPAWVPRGKALLADAAAGTLAAAAPGGDHQSAAAYLLAWTATTPGQLALASGLLDGGSSVPGLSVPAELRWALLERLAATGLAGQDRIEAERAADPTDAGQRGAAACRAATGDPAHKQAAWALLTAGRAGVETLIAVARGFALPEHADLLVPFAGQYAAAMERIWASGSAHLRVLIGDLLFPYPAASPELLARLEDVLAGTAQPGLVRVLAERADDVRRALASRALPPAGPAGPSPA